MSAIKEVMTMRTMNMKLIMIAGIISILVLFIPGMSSALDGPHNSQNMISCFDCHVQGTGPITNPSIICETCHNRPMNAPAGFERDFAPLVATHSSTAIPDPNPAYGLWGFECTDCHYFHFTNQHYTYGNALYLATAEVVSVNDASPNTAIRLTNFVINDTDYDLPANIGRWTQKSNQERGLMFLPYQWDYGFSLEIVSITQIDAVTYDIEVLGVKSADFPTRINVGQRAGIMYGQAIDTQPNYINASGVPVKFFDRTGPNNFAYKDGITAGIDDVPDGICQVCHIQTSHWQNDGSLAAIGAHAGQNGGNCMACHDHVIGFDSSGCDSCHGSPPVEDTLNAASTGGNSGLVDTPGITGSTTAGVHDTHVNKEGIGCNSCHYNSAGSGSTHNDDPPQVITLGFYLFGGAQQGGSYDGQSSAQYDATTTSPATTTSNANNKNCSTIYCHSSVQNQTDGSGTGITYASPSPVWDNALSVQCGSCHNADGVQGDLSLMDSGSHTRHVLDYSKPCDACHSSPSPGATGHVNNTIAVIMDTPYGGTYDGNGAGNHAPQLGYGTCSLVYCHGDGVSTTTTTSWGGTVNCGDCHGVNATTPPTSTSHVTHVGSSDVYLFNCKKCHNVTVTDTTDSTFVPTIASTSAHVNTTKDVDLNTGDPLVGTLATDDNAGTCSNVYCHSTSKDGEVLTSNLPISYGGSHYSDVTWGTGLTCSSCHGKAASTFTKPDGTPDYTSSGVGQVSSNSHFPHVVQSADCGICHNDTTTTGTGVISNIHVDGTADVRIANAYDNNNTIKTDNYDPTVGQKTCSNIYCHDPGNTGVISPGWGGALPDSAECDSCHGGNRASTSLSGNGPMSTGKHTGHINNNDAELGSFACGRCHSGTVTTPADRTITGTKHANQFNDVEYDPLNPLAPANTCTSVYCHSDGKGGFNNQVLSTEWNGAGTLDCLGCHGDNAVSQFGEPDYPSGTPGSLTANSHSLHVSVATDCSQCHADTSTSGTGITGTLHIDSSIDIVMNATLDGNGVTDNYDGTIGVKRCSSVACHGNGTSPQWGDNTAVDQCTKCHGTPTPTATVTDADKAPPTNLAGLPGAVTSNVSDDPIVGAHQAHLTVPNSYSITVVCSECHEVPASFSSTKHIYDGLNDTTFGVAEVTFGTLATTESQVPVYAGGGGTCDLVYCHGTSKADGSPATRVTPDWNTNLLAGAGGADCGLCHGNPPNTGGHSSVTANICSGCHDHVNDSATAVPFFNNLALHINGVLDGGGDCVSCHSIVRGDRRDVVNVDFTKTSHHINYISLVEASCQACHGALMTDRTHPGSAPVDPVTELQYPDTGTYFTASLRTDYTTYCKECHDADGATRLGVNALQPFLDSGDATTIGSGTIYDIAVGHGPNASCFGTTAINACHGNSGAAGTTLDPQFNAHGGDSLKMVFDTDTGTAGNQTAWPDTANNANHNSCTACHTTTDTNMNQHSNHAGMGVPCWSCHIAKPHGFTSARNTTNRGHLLTDGTSVPAPFRGAVNVTGDGAGVCSSGTNCYTYVVTFGTSGSWQTSNCQANTAAGGGGSNHSTF